MEKKCNQTHLSRNECKKEQKEKRRYTVEGRLVCDIIDQQYTHGSPVISYKIIKKQQIKKKKNKNERNQVFQSSGAEL